MRLEGVARVETAQVSGFARHTFKCSACGDLEQRLAFIKEVEPTQADTFHDSAPAIPPQSAAEKAHPAAPFLQRVFQSLATLWQSAGQRLMLGKLLRFSLSDPAAIPVPFEAAPSVRRFEPVSDKIESPPSSESILGFESDHDTDECENLLRRAIELVRKPTQSSPGSASLADAEAVTPIVGRGLAEVEAAPRATDTALVEVLDSETAATHPIAPHIAPGLLGSDSKPPGSQPETEPVAQVSISAPELTAPSTMPAEVASSVQPEKPRPRRIVVQIQYDSAKAKYVARDINTGLRIMRHEDKVRLRAMCNRMDWQIVDEEVSSGG